MIRFFALLFIVAALLPLALPARADQASKDAYLEKYGRAHNNVHTTLQPTSIQISLARLPGMGPDEFAIRLTSPDTVVGCFAISDLYYAGFFKEIYADIYLNGYEMDLRGQPNAPHYNCDLGYKNATAWVKMNRNDLIANGIKQYRIWNGPFANYYTIDMAKNKITLRASQQMGPVKFTPHSTGTYDPLTFWFYPQNTVLLYAPQARPDDDFEDKIRAFAEEKGMVPLDAVYPEFNSPLATGGFYYYVDRQNVIASTPGIESGLRLGAITIQKTVYGLKGDETAAQEMKIFARSPGMYQ